MQVRRRGWKGFGRPPSKFTWIRMESPCSNALAALVKSPGVPREAPVVRLR